MGSYSKAFILAALAAVAVVLALGLFNMARGGSMSRSQQLMRWRVALQFIAIIIMMTAIYLASH
jgi:ABC-type Na+ efflux pump permease subunit